MKHTIHSKHLSASIDTLGAELGSLKNTASHEEYIWQADPDIWSGSAPILFPVVGRLKRGVFTHQGKQYALPNHGFTRGSEFALIQKAGNQLTLQLTASDTTRRCYPFEFKLQVGFSLSNSGLSVDYKVVNLGEAVMFFSLGSHPGFALPGAISDYYLQFDQPETLARYHITNDLLSTDAEAEAAAPYLNNGSTIAINADLFSNDALVFKHIRSRQVSLHHQKTGPRLTLDTGGAPHLGLWAKPAASYVCIEPWYGYDDDQNTDGDINQKAGIQSLEAGQSFNTQYTITIGDP